MCTPRVFSPVPTQLYTFGSCISTVNYRTVTYSSRFLFDVLVRWGPTSNPLKIINLRPLFTSLYFSGSFHRTLHLSFTTNKSLYIRFFSLTKLFLLSGKLSRETQRRISIFKRYRCSVRTRFPPQCSVGSHRTQGFLIIRNRSRNKITV